MSPKCACRFEPGGVGVDEDDALAELREVDGEVHRDEALADAAAAAADGDEAADALHPELREASYCNDDGGGSLKLIVSGTPAHARAPQQAEDARAELGRAERLDDVVVGAAGEGLDDVLRRGVRREKEDRQRRRGPGPCG